MLKPIVVSQNNSTPADIGAAYKGWRGDWASAPKVRFAVACNAVIEASVAFKKEQGFGMVLKGFLKNGDGVEIYFDPRTGTGSVTYFQKSPAVRFAQAVGLA